MIHALVVDKTTKHCATIHFQVYQFGWLIERKEISNILSVSRYGVTYITYFVNVKKTRKLCFCLIQNS